MYAHSSFPDIHSHLLGRSVIKLSINKQLYPILIQLKPFYTHTP